MLILLTLGFYGLALLAIGILFALRRSFSYSWLAAALGAILAWGSIFAWQAELPTLVLEMPWGPTGLFLTWPVFFVDDLGWVYALALGALALAVILTAPAQSTGLSLSAWIGTLGLTSLGILAFLAANPLTLVIVWTGLDLLELANTLRLSRQAELSERVVISFGVRALGTGFALWASATNVVAMMTFNTVSPDSALFLFLAAGLRLGVLPLHLTYRSEPALRRGMGTVLRMAVASSSLVLLARIPTGLVEPVFAIFLQGLLVVALLYGAWKWLSSPGELSGRPYWLIGLGSLSLLAALRGSPQGSAAWGVALILLGGLLFLYSARQRIFTLALSSLVLGMLSLPFTLTASTWQGGAPLEWLFWPFLLAGQVMLAGGFVRHLWRKGETELSSLPRWAQSAYPFGLLVLAATMILSGLWGWRGALQVGLWPAGLAVALILAIGLAAWWRISKLSAISDNLNQRPVVRDSVSHLARGMEGFALALWAVYRFLRRLIDFFSELLEGDGGLLWTVLVLVLLLIWFRQFLF